MLELRNSGDDVNDIPAPFGYIIADNPIIIKDTLKKVGESMESGLPGTPAENKTEP